MPQYINRQETINYVSSYLSHDQDDENKSQTTAYGN